jgi:hypothetical protein
MGYSSEVSGKMISMVYWLMMLYGVLNLNSSSEALAPDLA